MPSQRQTYLALARDCRALAQDAVLVLTRYNMLVAAEQYESAACQCPPTLAGSDLTGIDMVSDSGIEGAGSQPFYIGRT